jgi:hypothetical protein
MRKVTFRLSIGLVGCYREETYTLKDLGIVEGEDFETEEELEKLLEEQWVEWRDNIVEGWFLLEESEDNHE